MKEEAGLVLSISWKPSLTPLKERMKPLRKNMQLAQPPGCHESATSLLLVPPLTLLTACPQLLSSQVLSPLSPHFCHSLSLTTHTCSTYGPTTCISTTNPIGLLLSHPSSVQQPLFSRMACSSWATLIIYVVSSSDTLLPINQST
jgi:hypothetical protein